MNTTLSLLCFFVLRACFDFKKEGCHSTSKQQENHNSAQKISLPGWVTDHLYVMS